MPLRLPLGPSLTGTGLAPTLALGGGSGQGVQNYFYPGFAATITASWDWVISDLGCVLQMWSARRIPTLFRWLVAIETLALSKAWYLVEILPLPLTLLAASAALL